MDLVQGRSSEVAREGDEGFESPSERDVGPGPLVGGAGALAGRPRAAATTTNKRPSTPHGWGWFSAACVMSNKKLMSLYSTLEGDRGAGKAQVSNALTLDGGSPAGRLRTTDDGRATHAQIRAQQADRVSPLVLRR